MDALLSRDCHHAITPYLNLPAEGGMIHLVTFLRVPRARPRQMRSLICTPFICSRYEYIKPQCWALQSHRTYRKKCLLTSEHQLLVVADSVANILCFSILNGKVCLFKSLTYSIVSLALMSGDLNTPGKIKFYLNARTWKLAVTNPAC